MIRCCALFCKLFQINNSSNTLYTDFIGKFRPFQKTCPSCHARGTLTAFSTYERYVVDFDKGGKPEDHRISVQRLVCSGCGHTHAVLPDFIIPYCQYSLLFVLRVLWSYFTRSKTVAELCEVAQITPSMLYRWKILFLKHYSFWLSALRQLEDSPVRFFGGLTQLSRPSEFFHAFFRKTNFSFLQSHKNPANCQRPPS